MDKIQNLLTKGVEKILPSKEFLKQKLNSPEKLTIYFGIDPTGKNLHLGHSICLRKLRQFQELGHKVYLLIGDFTAMIGDPTDKTAVRKQLTREQVLENCKTYKAQASKILNFEGENPAELVYNSEWLSKLKFKDILELSANFTVQRMLERDMFQQRLKNDKPIYLHEFLYPLMQGYDSVHLQIDGEIGGNDQMFNMMVGRNLEKKLLNKEKFVITMKLLSDPHGVKMGKTNDNMITFNDPADEMFGKIMSWPDEMIIPGFELCTDIDMDEVKKLEQKLEDPKTNPRDLKINLAKKIIEIFHSKQQAEKAEQNFIRIFQKKQQPEQIPEKTVQPKKLIDILVETGLTKSKSEARRLIDQKGIKINNQTITDQNFEITLEHNNAVIQKGKRFFVKIKIKN